MEKTDRLRLIPLLFVLLCLLAPTTDSRAIENGPDKVSVQLDWKFQFEYAGFIAAVEKGFYEDV